MSDNSIALVFDADYTLLNEYHPNAVLRKRGVDIDNFWKQVAGTQKLEAETGELTSLDIIYLAHFMNEVRHGKLKGLTIREMIEIGKDVDKTFYPGIPEFFPEIRKEHPDCTISFYTVSVGIKPLLEGSALGQYMDYIYGYTFFDTMTEGPVIDEIKSTSSAREKIPSIVGISYGDTGLPGFDFPIKNMIYFGDGETDRPAFRFVKKRGGTVVCVYDPKKDGARERAEKLRDDATFLIPADYTRGSELWDCVHETILNSKESN